MLGADIRALRESRGFTMQQVADGAGISVDSIKKLEAGGRYPTLRTLEALADFLHMNVVIGPTETIIEPLD